MDYFTFLRSGSSLAPGVFARLGWNFGETTPPVSSSERRGRGEGGGHVQGDGRINTHKGLIFSLGILCAASGMLEAVGRACPRMLHEAAAGSSGVGADF
ncbi:hypothetical protein MASR2M79_13460 [Aminivibrio sp.]